MKKRKRKLVGVDRNQEKKGTGCSIFKNGHYMIREEVEQNIHAQATVENYY